MRTTAVKYFRNKDWLVSANFSGIPSTRRFRKIAEPAPRLRLQHLATPDAVGLMVTALSAFN
jgi:hypothetical protein